VYLFNNITNVSMNCKADGASHYYWENHNGNYISLADANIFTFTKLKPENAGSYRCVATNASGASYSNYAELTIYG